MAGFSTSVAQSILNWLRGTAMPSPPLALYAALYSGDPGSDGSGGSEVTGTVSPTGRQEVTFSGASGKTIANANTVDFGEAQGVAALSHVAFFDAATGGTYLVSQPLKVQRATVIGEPVRFKPGALNLVLVP